MSAGWDFVDDWVVQAILFCFLFCFVCLYVFGNNFQLMSDSQFDDLEMSNIKFKKSISILFTLHTDLT